MFANSHHGQPSEYVSGLALELLGEVRIRMMECRLVLKALADEADLNLDELDRDLHAAPQSARWAYEAAGLVNKGARLDPRWGSDWSRPKAIFARHDAAVRDGAQRVDPTPAFGDRLDRSLWQLSPAGSVDHVPDLRSTCTGTVRAARRWCTASAMYLGAGLFAAHCYSHATPAERDQYRAHQASAGASQSNACDDLLGRQRDAGDQLCVQWLHDRDSRRQWVDEIGSTIPGAQ